MSDLRQRCGLACPCCKQADNLHLVTSSTVDLTVDGIKSFGDHKWHLDAFYRCPQCDHIGVVGDFRIDKPGITICCERITDSDAFELKAVVEQFIATAEDYLPDGNFDPSYSPEAALLARAEAIISRINTLGASDAAATGDEQPTINNQGDQA